jgi:deazaflavin-dependent oxidoreductase (nitroreductase family)
MTTADPRSDRVAFTRALIADHRAHGGRITSGPFEGRPVLLLHTVGARTGEPRIAPLVYSRDDDRFVVMASKAGAPTNPSWFFNLVAHPEVTIEAEGETFRARAMVAEGAERDRLWRAHVAEHPSFAAYERQTSRVIPAISLERLA